MADAYTFTRRSRFMTDPTALRILDANLNRAGEGLRVVEDFLRMGLDDAHLCGLVKRLRHELGLIARDLAGWGLVTMRDTAGDVGTAITTDSETERSSPLGVAVASTKRAQQSLRVIEEYGKLVDTQVAARAEQLRYRLYTLEQAMTATAASRERLQAARLCVLLEGGQSTAEFAEQVARLVEVGAGMIQLRDKTLDDRTLLDRATALANLCRERGAFSIVNDRADIAAAAGADGVHLGQEDLPPAIARRIVGPHRLIGVSTHNIEQARQAVLDGADYLGAGPTFPSQTKQFAEYPGLAFLRAVAAEVSLPTLAIGGIDVGNVGQVVETGITRIATASAVTSSSDPTSTIQQLLKELGPTDET